MRLNQIKLAGFKSFAEPTTFQLPGQRIGVVGPNGCGKSNIMDAVRWVLGESKASELRGESMQDVIFNGSGERKPAGRASVELVFDNTSARAGGPWNQYTEIAVKRVLTRDGNSSYYINNQVVRRRDVQDVFLGTGLGPRAYAIIGQGTISRIIESRPEELRLFLEEAAGVSKYKERRRETETRLKDTRENLTRVQDILRELNANLEKLEHQAEVARIYHAQQQQATQKQHQLWHLKQREAAAEQQKVHQAFLDATTALDARLAELRQGEAQLEATRVAHYAASDALHAKQGELADAALEVSRLEERIRYAVEAHERAQARLAELRTQGAEWNTRRGDAQQEVEQLVGQMQAADDLAANLRTQAEAQGASIPDAEEALRVAQAHSRRQREAVTAVQQQIQVLAADSRGVDEQTRTLKARGERLSTERAGLHLPDLDKLAALRSSSTEADAHAEQRHAALQEGAERLPAMDAERRAQQEAVNKLAAREAEVRARMDALRALQEKVQTEGKLKPWLARHGLDSLPGLWKRLHIEQGWEPALEAALRERIGALAVGKLETVRAFAGDAPPARLAFYTLPQQPTASTHHRLSRLADMLRIDDDALLALLRDWLEGVYVGSSLDDALAQRAELTQGEIIMTREGHAVSAHAVSFYAPDTEQAGMLARAQEIEALQAAGRDHAQATAEARGELGRREAAYAEAARLQDEMRREAQTAQSRAHDLRVELLRLTQQADSSNLQRSRLDGELTEIDAQLARLAERRTAAEAQFEALDGQLATAQQTHAELDDAVLAAEGELNRRRDELRSLERRLQEAQFQARALTARRAELLRAIEVAEQQIGAQQQAVEQLELEIASFDDTAAQSGLHDALEVKLQREEALAAARRSYDELSTALRAAEEQRMRTERSIEPLRQAIIERQLEEQAARLAGEQFQEQLTAAQVDLEAIAASIVAGNVKLSGLQGEIDRIHREIEALGAVNLAALEELTAAAERKTFLDAQTADLSEAIQTLEDAIHKIDLETRELLADTFRQVNDHFGRMFPLLFGGGTAKLVMTGDEILDAGVQVMAQPPGKRNSTIHLLSGGEKALTAIALVFAIFQLNPAPFCLLDEVDAPLDDANTERYCRLVSEMSEGTQFLFISHNKIAMEMAEQLIGVTMQEQGVSRIVAVDIDAALDMAEAA